MIIAVGSAPSSGSTYLADLLDSLPCAVCGPETQLFSVEAHYEGLDAIRNGRFPSSRTPSIYLRRQSLLVSALVRYGIDVGLLLEFARDASTFQAFATRLLEAFATIRGKACSHYFEKTPQNIHCAPRFLEAFPTGAFVHIVRHPAYVARSLVRRGFPRWVAAHAWLFEVARAWSLRDHPRFFTVRYEDLVANPFEVTCELSGRLGASVTPRELRQSFEANDYRRLFCTKFSTWTYSDYGALGNANAAPLAPDDVALTEVVRTARISDAYASEFGLPAVDFATLAAHYGYDLKAPAADRGPAVPVRRGARDHLLLLRKLGSDLRYVPGQVGSVLAYLSPTAAATTTPDKAATAAGPERLPSRSEIERCAE